MTKHNIWHISIIGLLFALLFTPLVVANSMYFPFVTGKVFTFRILVSILFICWVLLILKKPEYAPKKSPVLIISGIFVLWLACANFLGVDRFNSFFSNFERMEGWFTHLYFLLYLLVLSSTVKSEHLWNWLLNISIVVANIIALKAVFDSASRTQVILGNSTYVAIYVLFNLFFACFFLYRLFILKTKEDAVKIVGILYYVCSALLFTYVIFKTQTRGTVLALVFSALLFFVLTAISYWKNKKVRIASISILILGILGLILFWTNRNTDFIQKNELLVRVATISATEGTGKARLVNWGIALNGIKERPVFGWGQENYMYVFAQKYNPKMYAQEPWFDRTHNAFLDWSIQGGIPAGFIYISMFLCGIYLIYVSTSLRRIEKNILISLFVAYGIHNLFVFDNYSSYLMFYTLLGLTIFHSNVKEKTCNFKLHTKQTIVIVLIISTIGISFFTILRPMQVGSQLIHVLQEQDANRALDIYESIFQKNTFGNTEAGIRIISDINRFFQTNDQKVIERYVQIVIPVGKKFAESNDVRRLETYGTFLYQIGDIQNALYVLEKAQTLAPNRQNNLYTLGLAYLSDKKIEESKIIFKHAYEILPENEKAKNYYGALLFATGNSSENELMKGYDYNDPFFLALFGRTNMYGEIVKIRELRKLDNPTDYQNQVSLAIAYYLNKQPVQAITIIKELQKLVPEFKQQGDYLIQEIYAGRSLIK